MIQDDLKKVGARMRELRKAKGFTGLDEFAYVNKLNRGTYGRMEKGYNMTMKNILRVAHAHKMTLEDFFKGVR